MSKIHTLTLYELSKEFNIPMDKILSAYHNYNAYHYDDDDDDDIESLRIHLTEITNLYNGCEIRTMTHHSSDLEPNTGNKRSWWQKFKEWIWED